MCSRLRSIGLEHRWQLIIITYLLNPAHRQLDVMSLCVCLFVVCVPTGLSASIYLRNCMSDLHYRHRIDKYLDTLLAMKSETTAIFAPQDGRWKITVSFDGRRFCVPKFRH